MMLAIDFDARSDGGPRLVGPFENDEQVRRYLDAARDAAIDRDGDWDAGWCVVPLAEPSPPS